MEIKVKDIKDNFEVKLERFLRGIIPLIQYP